MSFSSLGLSEQLVRATSDQGYETPSPIQAQAIPAVLSGRDVMAAAQTGTGKTAGFTLPLLQRLGENPRTGKGPRALILTPTRELAAQVHDSVNLYSKYVPTKAAVVFGGVKINPQMMKLRKGLDVLVATPGRLMDLYQQNAVRFNEVEILVLDEADRMLDMGFIRDIRKILALLPAKRQNLLFSATFSNEIRTLAEGLLDNPVQVEVAARNTSAENIKQSVYPVDQSQKTALLSKLVRDNSWDQVLVFTRTKHGANRLTQKLEKDGITAAAIHGNKSQGARTRALADFKAGEVRVLVATDIAARGLDIKQLPQVVNFELPNVPEDYVHRIGRTGRAGESGHALSLVSADEGKMLAGIERLIKKQLPRTEVEGFEPTNNLPLKPRAKADPSRARTRSSNGGGNGRPGGKPKSFGDKPGGRSGGRSQNGGGQRSRSAQRQSA
ncbi:ATP-dependent RNA helicase RhlE [Marinobacter flavimaris]|jgi:ATP-dependent RNA helicase RhlE|uniref:ATP-dependent RNA helicase RhlE n=1 Tax=Marinobacter flavimaris TaxID=262076 RepID=A0A3D8H1L9_9GAMM|nr:MULTISPECIES: DEAD/DEAH box helicase [Marinobacter]MCP4061936.1 DEAD/DEAH box helicase [Gammaproteobacteria bacterium]MEC7727915.1 DEAD/DEAH box helicase [Pseudomonadota bacterium]MAK48165.1 ATP-dependent RNA helicase RhlE [Marinobacter sp.]PHS50218.1 MAG: ATP-dependent RNA helicase RhlE [Marinobacter sp.]PPI79869.1 ATP-dependent RNA helicase RhlE [Marinobacter flavimaris]|tara:strand:- start:104 stop:1426 length:1323 start_codon:yes stop_codon:yes gene_type:complete